MDELIKLLTSKTGITETLAQQIIPVIVEFLKDKLPGPIADQIEGLLTGASGESAQKGGLGGLLGGIGDMLGGKQDN